MPVLNTQVEGCPNADEIRAALGHMAASEAFRGSPQLVAFLRYVVEATLRGEQDRIKGYTIAIEALGRGDDFDPQIDPIVRVEATRLRRAINRYYENGGRNDAVQIELPLGSYVPRFRRCALAGAGRHAVARAHEPSETPTSWRDFLSFLTAYLANDDESAARHAAAIASETDPLGLVARALVAAHRGETDTARELVDRLAASGPALNA